MTVTPAGRRQFEIDLTVGGASGAAIRPITMNGQPPPEGRVRIVDARGREVARLAVRYEGWGFSGTLFRTASNGVWPAPAGVHGKLREGVTRADVKIVDLFQYPTVSALAAHLSAAEGGEPIAPGPGAPARSEDVAAEAERRQAGRERLGRRRGIRTALAGPEGADA